MIEGIRGNVNTLDEINLGFKKLPCIGQARRTKQEEIKLLPIKEKGENRARAYRIINVFLNVIEDIEGELSLDNEFRLYLPITKWD